jgi:hypothetical protein
VLFANSENGLRLAPPIVAQALRTLRAGPRRD